MQKYIMPLVELLCQMAPYLLLGFLIAGVLHAFVPSKLYSKYLSRNNFRSSAIAALIGIPLPLCSCGVIPTAMSMRREGASRAATTSFLIATPQTGVDSIAATAALMGWPFALLRPIAALVTALFGGGVVSLVERAHPEDNIPKAVEEKQLHKGFWARCWEAVRYGLGDMIENIGKWLIIGLVVAGAITVFVPDDFFAIFSGNTLLSMLLVLVVAVPMYICATGSVPIAAALMLKGLSPGTALVMLMAGPAANMASIMVLGKELGRRSLITYLATIICGSIAFGLVADYLLPAEWFSRVSLHAAHSHGAGISLFEGLCGGLFIVLLVSAFWRRYRRNRNNQKQMNMTREFKVKGMMCGHCQANVERGLAALEGVTAVVVNLASGTVRVEGTATDEAIRACIERLGYECPME